MEFSARGVALLVLTCVVSTCYCGTAPSLAGVISLRDQQRLKQLFQQADVAHFSAAHYVVGGLSFLGGDKKVEHKVCEFLKKNSNKLKSLWSVYHLTSTAKLLGEECKVTVPEEKIKELTPKELNSSSLYFLAASMTNLGKKVDKNVVSVDSLVAAINEEELPISYGLAFQAASLLTVEKPALTQLVDMIEDVVGQADESPTTLYYEGGVDVTATAMVGIFELSKKAGVAPALTHAQATKFGNFIASNKYAASVRDAFSVLSAAHALASNQFVVPAALLLTSHKQINSQNRNLVLQLTDMLGRKVGPSMVKLQSIQDPAGETENRNKPFTALDNGFHYSYSFFGDASKPGVYKITCSTESKGDSVVAELTSVEFSVSVSYSVEVKNAKLEIIEKEQNVAIKTVNLNYPETSSDPWSADHHNLVKMTFSLVNKQNGDLMTVHQVFVQLSANGEEIFFVATHNNDNVYSFELDVADVAKESFNHRSGTYAMSLVVGGIELDNPSVWDIGKLALKFSGTPAERAPSATEQYKALPEIQHMFRPPNKHPPVAVSTAFTILALAPLGLLFILWLVIGVNISNIGVSGIWGILFHLGLTGIFGLYYLFFLKLNMFQTLQYLLLIGGITFFVGNRMLRRIAQKGM